MAIIRWDPFSELNSLHNQVNSLFNETFGSAGSGVMSPATDVYQDEKGLTIEAHLPNFSDDEISVDEHDGAIEIRAEHKEKEEKGKSKGKRYIMRESVSQYFRRFALPNNADKASISADYDKGVLKVVIPFKELPAPKHIQIKSKNK